MSELSFLTRVSNAAEKIHADSIDDGNIFELTMRIETRTAKLKALLMEPRASGEGISLDLVNEYLINIGALAALASKEISGMNISQ